MYYLILTMLSNVCGKSRRGFCVAYTKCIATLWHELIYLFVNKRSTESLSRGLMSKSAAVSHTDFGCKRLLLKVSRFSF